MKKKVGRKESVSFTDLGIENMKAKIDTGAYGIALHVDGIEIVDDKINFWIGNKSNIFVFDKYKKIKVKNSFGEKQERYSILTRIKLGDNIYKFYVSLTDRKNMKYPVLIGRRFLHKFNYLVDVRQKNIHHDRDKKM
jgi:hypothetical protein